MIETLLLFWGDICLLLGYISGGSSFPKPLKPEEEERLLAQMAEGDSAARDKLIEHNLRLVAHVCRKFGGSRTPQEDLISIGTIGLIKAVNTFKPGRSARLATYAARCIENELLMYIRSSRRHDNEVSFNEPVGIDAEGNELTNLDILGTPPDEVEQSVQRRIGVERILKAAREELDERELRVFSLRFGLTDGVCYPQREVAQMLGISRSYVSRIEKRAVDKLKACLRP